MRSDPPIAVVVPAHQAEGEIGDCIAAILASGFTREEILVVDDGSRDRTGEIARGAGVRVLRNDTALRPARARNAGVAATASDIVVFVDADVLIAPGARNRIVRFFADHPDHVAIFGSYDAAPPARQRAVSRYRNILHHWVHQTSRPEAATFWTGFGAVRRAGFDAAGGLDPDWEDIEDVELGLRMRAAGGRILLDRDLLATHLKDWTIRGMMRTDRRGRAVPWTRLLRSGRTGTGDLNLTGPRRFSAPLVALLPFALLAGIVWTPALWIALALFAGYLALNARLFAYLARVAGPGLALRSVAYHALHLVAALAGYVQVRLFERSGPAR
ncbi:glycosyltransferase family 2 protein [Palleronia sp. LCG004]|uniref:glycosyltransferase n=1 Tax=Palleronia sp. LCG004 TaxID=3079304 RepID=UPI002941EE31|nr:glycosyltransferase family 2 protein [Palleronia sp. LCG004]WOI56630.1 glycosyltransferase family 2 protein [Palleronia sp. LCG004]